MTSLPFGIHLGGLHQTSAPRFSFPKLIVFLSAVLIGLGFWVALGWLVLQLIP